MHFLHRLGTVVNNDSVDTGQWCIAENIRSDTGNYLVFNDLTDFVDSDNFESQTKNLTRSCLPVAWKQNRAEFESDIIFTVNYK